MQVYDSLDRPGAIEEIAGLLRSDGVVVLPTDTLYGFSGLLSSRVAYERIASIKRDVSGRRYLTLAASTDMVERYIVSWGCTSQQDMVAVWPSALTAIFSANPEWCPPWVGATLAIRVPDSAVLRQLIELVGEPLVSTSVNRSGEAPMTQRKAIVKSFAADIDGFVAGKHSGRDLAASTLVDFTGERPSVLRSGSFLWGG